MSNAAFSNQGGKQFINKLKAIFLLSAYSTVFGTNSTIHFQSLHLVDAAGGMYMYPGGGVNSTTTGDIQMPGPPVCPLRPMRSIYHGWERLLFFVLEKNATSQLFGSFYGQIGGFDDHVDGGTTGLMRRDHLRGDLRQLGK